MSKNRTCIGILGGGQLARMSAYQAYKLGFDVAIMEKEANSPAGMLTKNEFVGWVDNQQLLKEFANISGVVTLENEFIDYHYLSQLEEWGVSVLPSSATIRLIQDKLIQKQTLKQNNIPVADFVNVGETDSYSAISAHLGSSFILKSRKMGYDGYGNHKVNSEADYQKGKSNLSKRFNLLMAEKLIPFQMELAVMVVRSRTQLKIYPLVETRQENHICKIVIAPSGINPALEKRGKEIAAAAVEAVNGYGIFGIELFLEGENILVNEMAPRPHNSGHYTIEGTVTSQFENHIRAVLNLPLGSTDLVKKYAVMVNILGKRGGEGFPANYPEVLKEENIHLHIYGKRESRVGRKMGHITLTGDELSPLLTKGTEIEKLIDL